MDKHAEVTIPPYSAADRLDSWKAIASHLHRDIRTVQRWQREGLPVYRHRHFKYGSIYAYKTEVDSWWPTRQAARKKIAESRSFQFAVFKAPVLKRTIYAGLALLIGLLSLMSYHLFGPRIRRLIAQTVPSKQATIVVLPFQDLSSNSHAGAQASQFTSELISEIQRAGYVRVVQYHPDGSDALPSENFAAVARALHADAAVEGSIRYDGTHATISATLIRGSTGHALWSTQFEQEDENLKAFQQRAARTTALGIRNILF